MLVKGNVLGDVYINLMYYIFESCDTISLSKYEDQHADLTSKVVNTMLSDGKYLKKDIITLYSSEFLENMFQEFKNNIYIFDQRYQNNYEKNESGLDYNLFQKFAEDNRRSCIYSGIMELVYANITAKWISNNKENIISKKDIIIEDELENKKIHHSTIYNIKLTEEIKEEILKKKSIYEWCFPNSLEDIAFYKNGYCWLYSVGHEEICDIYCESEEEYVYLKSIGVAFLKDKFILEPKENLHYTRMQ